MIQGSTPSRAWSRQTTGHLKKKGAKQPSHYYQEAAFTLGRVSRRAIKSIYNLVGFPFPPLLDSLLLLVVHPHPRVDLSCVLSNPPYFSSSHLKIPHTTFLFHHLRQSTSNPSRDLFTLCGNTIGYMSITHLSHKSDCMPVSSALEAPSSLMVRASTLKVSIDPIFWSTGTDFADG